MFVIVAVGDLCHCQYQLIVVGSFMTLRQDDVLQMVVQRGVEEVEKGR